MIVVAGSINLDLIARVSRLPLPGETVSGISYETAPGGKGANQALASRRAGAEVALIGAVGRDANADQALALLADADVDLGAVSRLDDLPTGVALILVNDVSGENQIAVVPGANGELEPQSVELRGLASGDHLVLQMEVPTDVNDEALKLARSVNAFSILNIAPYNDDAPGLAQRADVTIANETEFECLATAMALSGSGYEERASAYAQKTGRTIIITLGSDGAIAAHDDAIFHASSPKIEPIDTVGAGDTFCGALAVALSEGASLPQAMHFACAAGALACLKHGAQPSIPTRSQIEQILS